MTAVANKPLFFTQILGAFQKKRASQVEEKLHPLAPFIKSQFAGTYSRSKESNFMSLFEYLHSTDKSIHRIINQDPILKGILRRHQLLKKAHAIAITTQNETTYRKVGKFLIHHDWAAAKKSYKQGVNLTGMWTNHKRAEYLLSTAEYLVDCALNRVNDADESSRILTDAEKMIIDARILASVNPTTEEEVQLWILIAKLEQRIRPEKVAQTVNFIKAALAPLPPSTFKGQHLAALGGIEFHYDPQEAQLTLSDAIAYNPDHNLDLSLKIASAYAPFRWDLASETLRPSIDRFITDGFLFLDASKIIDFMLLHHRQDDALDLLHFFEGLGLDLSSLRLLNVKVRFTVSPKQALKLAKEIKSPYWKALALIDIASKIIYTQPNEAIKILKKAKSLCQRLNTGPTVLLEIAKLEAKIDPNAALATLEDIRIFSKLGCNFVAKNASCALAIGYAELAIQSSLENLSRITLPPKSNRLARLEKLRKYLHYIPREEGVDKRRPLFVVIAGIALVTFTLLGYSFFWSIPGMLLLFIGLSGLVDLPSQIFKLMNFSDCCHGDNLCLSFHIGLDEE